LLTTSLPTRKFRVVGKKKKEGDAVGGETRGWEKFGESGGSRRGQRDRSAKPVRLEIGGYKAIKKQRGLLGKNIEK